MAASTWSQAPCQAGERDDPGERVHGRGAGRADAGHDGGRAQAGGHVCLQGRGERLGAHGVGDRVDVDEPQVAQPVPGQGNCLRNRRMRVRCGVNRERRALGLQAAARLGVIRRPLARGRRGDEACAGGAVGDDALPGRRERSQLAQPLGHDFLDLGQRGSGLPGDPERPQPGGGQVAQHRSEGCVGREPAEVARMLNLGHARDDDAVEVGQYLAERLGLLRCVARQLARHLPRRHLRLDRQLRDPATVIGDPVDQLVTSGPELLRPHRDAPIGRGSRRGRCRGR